MSSTNLGICGLCRLCCASSVFCKHCFSRLAFAQGFGGSWESLILPSASLLQLLGLRVWLFFSSCWSLKLVGQAPSLDFSLAQWNVLVVMSQQAGLAQRRQKLRNICRACRRSSCVPRSSPRGEGLKTAHNKYLPGFSIHKSEQENVPGQFQLPGKGWQGQKKWSHNFPKQRIIQTLCFSSKGSWGGTAENVLFSCPPGSCSVRHKLLHGDLCHISVLFPGTSQPQDSSWNRSVLKSEEQMKMWQPVAFWVCSEMMILFLQNHFPVPFFLQDFSASVGYWLLILIMCW